MQENNIIFYDGFCPLCNKIVRFIINKDKPGVFKFAPLDSHIASKLIPDSLKRNSGVDSVILKTDNGLYIKSKAAFKILSQLKTCWKILMIFKVLPTSINDKLYDFIAGNRFKIFGRYDSCPIPSPDQKQRFISF